MHKEVVSAEWLNNNQSNKNLIILDASPKKTISGKVSTVADLCIPNARIFDIKGTFSNQESNFPNTVPSAAQFEKACQSLGIYKDSKIVVYDNLGIYTSPRAWWLFKTMGHENISVLDGGLPEWVKAGFETVKKSTVIQEFPKGNFKSKINEEFVIEYETVIENTVSNNFKIVDARSTGRFSGTADEPRKHLKSGSIPNSINIPSSSLLENGKFKSIEDLREIFTKKTTKKDKLVFSCGSGITACIVMLASEIAFKKSRYLYDGSWTEYAELQNLNK